MDEPNMRFVLIWSGEHHAYWRPNSAGYTTDGLAAGVYEREKAEAIVRGTDLEKRLSLREINSAWPVLAAFATTIAAEATERAARIADECPLIVAFAPGCLDGASSAARQIAAAIRSSTGEG